MITVTLEYWSPESQIKWTPIFRHTKDITEPNEISIFETFYKMNNQMRYCNGYSYKFQDKSWETKYKEWLKSDDYQQKSFNLYYGGGVVD